MPPISPKPRKPDAPSIRLAHVPGAQGDNNLIGQRGVEQLPLSSRPALLISYAYLDPFLKIQEKYAYRDWVLDSGAFSAFTSGKVIVLQDYINKCHELKGSDPTLVEIFALDVIGDWKGSIANAKEMWKQGIEAIPCFHYGEPWDLLKELCKEYPKVAIGGCVGKRDKDEFASQCFARVWPKKLHGFGFGSEKSIMLNPWHSVDATNWETGPCVTADTLVSTSKGLEYIGDLTSQEDITIRTYQGVEVPGCRAVYSGSKPTITLTLKTDQVLNCTPNHKILTEEGWKEAGELVIGDRVRVPSSHNKYRQGKWTQKQAQYITLTQVMIGDTKDVYDILMPQVHHFLANGMVVHNCAFGRWNAFGGSLSVRGSSQNLRAEVEWYLDLERRARDRWKREMIQLEELEPTKVLHEKAPTIRLAVIGSGREGNAGLFKTLKEIENGQ